MFGNDRTQLRQQFFDVWQKMQQNAILTPLESQIANVINQHKEYTAIFSNAEANLNKDYFPELGDTNPFLHMSLHIALQEQLSTNRPFGIVNLYQQAVKQKKSEHDAQHCLMNALAESMWQAQQQQRQPTEQEYLDLVKRQLL